MKQVEKSHYEFGRYMTKARWISIWHQLDEVSRLRPERVLEIGPGPGLFKLLANSIGLTVETLDIDPELAPDHIGSASAIPLPDNSFDVVCAFQVLEHIPYEAALKSFSEMARVSRRNVVISLPDAKPMWRYMIHVPMIGTHDVLIPRPMRRTYKHEFDGEHYWEVNKKGYEHKRVAADLERVCKLVRSYRVIENPYHRFYVFAVVSG